MTLLSKSRVSGPHVGKSGSSLENCHVSVSLILCCLQHFMTSYVTSALSSYEYGRNIRFTGV